MPMCALSLFCLKVRRKELMPYLAERIYDMAEQRRMKNMQILIAMIIIALIPLALRGVKYREVSAGKLLSRNLLIYGLGGLIAPFIFVKLIDMLLVMTGLV